MFTALLRCFPLTGSTTAEIILWLVLVRGYIMYSFSSVYPVKYYQLIFCLLFVTLVTLLKLGMFGDQRIPCGLKCQQYLCFLYKFIVKWLTQQLDWDFKKYCSTIFVAEYCLCIYFAVIFYSLIPRAAAGGGGSLFCGSFFYVFALGFTAICMIS